MASKDKISRPKHTLWYRFMLKIARWFLIPVIKRRYSMDTTRYKGEVKGPFLVVCNHISRYDIPCTLDIFPHYSRYIISDAMVRKPASKIIFSIITDGIYRRKGENANYVVKSCKATIDSGINVCMFPEGTRSPNGVTLPIRKRTGQMVKELGVPLMTYRLKGSYFIKPLWAKNRAKGPMFGGIVNVYTVEQLEKMTVEEINDVIYKDLYFNHYDWVKETRLMYKRDDPAEYMERVLHTCPKCESEGQIRTEHDKVICDACGYTVRVNEFGLYVGEDAVFDNLYDWDHWQKERLRSKYQEWKDDPDREITFTEHVKVSKVIDNDPKIIDDDARISITFNEFIIKGKKVDIHAKIDEMSGLGVTHKNSMGASIDGSFYSLSPGDRQNIRKYRTIRRIITCEEDI